MKNPSMLLVGSVVLILLAVALVAIIDRTTPRGNSSDVRARATAKQALTVTAVVAATDETKGTVLVDNVQLSDDNRTGAPQNFGSWLVTAPAAFNFASVSPGVRVTIGVDAATFQVSTHTMSAVAILPAK